MFFRLSYDIFGWPDFSKPLLPHENRRPAAFPIYSGLPVREWGKKTNKWYNDNFAWRPQIVAFYRYINLQILKTPLKEFVPGIGDWVFRRNDTWPEVNDYIGCINIDGSLLDDWVTLIEGRVTWAEAHGTHYAEAITPMKAQVHPEKMLPHLQPLRKKSIREHFVEHIEKSFAITNVFFYNDRLKEEVAKGRSVFYEEDHHVNAYGCWLIYDELAQQLGNLWFPGIKSLPFFDNPPSDVLARKTPGCWVNDDRRLEISNPGSKHVDNPEQGIVLGNNYPNSFLNIVQPGTNRTIVFAHDSFLRYSLASWRQTSPDPIAIPLGPGFNKIMMFIFQRFTTERLDDIVTREIPDVLVEQFPEGKLILGVSGLDQTMRRAAEFGKASKVPESFRGKCHAMAVFDNVQNVDSNKAIIAQITDSNGGILARQTIKPGIRRAVFFGEIPVSDTLSAKLENGTSDSVRLELRSK